MRSLCSALGKRRCPVSLLLAALSFSRRSIIVGYGVGLGGSGTCVKDPAGYIPPGQVKIRIQVFEEDE